ncbi:DUF2637 domain-containing protein [Streptomyces sp. NPDC014746]|uniref:DUF2637 domain-containing protein n=1 Tax=Streptomyces sp. NPDC014746 TaxID=3364904 RepID=UPI003701F32D
MSRHTMERVALFAAAAVIVALTGLAFWLSYAHLAEVAGAHGLGHAPARKWAWPATLDAFIVGGELLMLRAGLQHRTDWWAITATAAGSVGSIVLNVAGVAGDNPAAVPVLDYVTAAVPPTAALIAFGLLMRQIHSLAADEVDTPATTVDTMEIERDIPASTPAAADFAPAPAPAALETVPLLKVDTEAPEVDTTPSTPAPLPAPELAPAPAPPLVICGDHLPVPTVPPRPRLSAEQAAAVIEQAWRDRLSIREAARLSTRVPSYVQKVYARLDEDTSRPIEGQTEIALPAAS